MLGLLVASASCGRFPGLGDRDGGGAGGRDADAGGTGGGAGGTAGSDAPVPDGPPDRPGDGRMCATPIECQDLSICNGIELCAMGACVRGTPLKCDDGIACTDDGCAEPIGCQNKPNDGKCPGGQRCMPSMGGCVDKDACFVDAQCDDGKLCDGKETCTAGKCKPAAPLPCNDGVACTVDACVDPLGCVYTPDPGKCTPPAVCDARMGGCVTPADCTTDAACDDKKTCTGTETCAGGKCKPGIPPPCDDGNKCTADACSPSLDGCIHTPVSCPPGQVCDALAGGCVTAPECKKDGDCDDGKFCDGAERCVLGRCRPAPAPPCWDNDDCTLDVCEESAKSCTNPAHDADGDGFGDATCGGTDCDDGDPAIHPGVVEACSNGRDDNCDKKPDCADPACVADSYCTMCVPPGDGGMSGEICTNGKDDDCDVMVDCRDPDCAADPACCKFNQEFCDNGADDDCDGFKDCKDPSCTADPACTPCKPGVEICANGIDDDCDGATDCKDGKCKKNPACDCTAPEACRDGVDNDCDGKVDCNDPDCAGDPVCVPCGPEVCRDGKDNDCDGKVDCDDPECKARIECMFCLPFEYCGDGLDNDCNGKADCDDKACAAMPGCVPGCESIETFCRDGKDNDCDGFKDCADPDCKMNPVCLLCLPSELLPFCQDGVDDDCDGLIDCDDKDCKTHPACLGR